MPMLTYVVDLDIHSGERPEKIRLKKGTDDVEIIFRIAAGPSLETKGTAVLQATKPDGSELFRTFPIESITPFFITVVVPDVTGLTDQAGQYQGTFTIVDTEGPVTREGLRSLTPATVQPFSMFIEPRRRRPARSFRHASGTEQSGRRFLVPSV